MIASKLINPTTEASDNLIQEEMPFGRRRKAFTRSPVMSENRKNYRKTTNDKGYDLKPYLIPSLIGYLIFKETQRDSQFSEMRADIRHLFKEASDRTEKQFDVIEKRFDSKISEMKERTEKQFGEMKERTEKQFGEMKETHMKFEKRTDKHFDEIRETQKKLAENINHLTLSTQLILERIKEKIKE